MEEKIHIVRLKKDGKIFEIIVDPDKAIAFREGKNIPIDEVLMVFDVFKDAKKGDRASGLKEAFNTDSIEEIAKIILKEGEIHLTAEYLRKLKEKKKKEVIELIHRNAINPQTNLPIPYDVIERALVEAKVNIDPHKSAEQQLNDVVRKLKYVMPIKIENKRLSMRIPANFTGKCYSVLHKLCNVEHEKWNSDGSLSVIVSVTAGNYGNLIEQLERLSHGEVEIKDITE